MCEQQRQFLALIPNIPARLTVQQTAWTLNFAEHDIPVLIAQKLLRPLGNPPENGVKYTSAHEILELRKDRTWLSRATNVIHEHWRKKNEMKREKKRLSEESNSAF